jgi:hypothetical protein
MERGMIFNTTVGNDEGLDITAQQYLSNIGKKITFVQVTTKTDCILY